MFSRKFSNTIHKKKRLLISILTLLVITLGLGYSAFSSNFSFLGSLDVTGHMEPTLYNVLKKEAVTGGLAREYTGSHGDSMDSTKSTEKIYHWYAANDTEGTQILDKNNVIFAGQCWQMIRTTDTGGVKMIYNGEAENGKCLNTRGNHVGYVERTSQTLNSNYWYGTDYTYDSTNGVFSIAGTTEQTTWSEANAPGLIGKYTCRGTTESTTCQTLYLVESYYNTTSGYVISLNANSHYSQFGTLEFNANHNSLADVGYMYNTRYIGRHNIISNNETILSSLSLSTSYWYADSVTWGSPISDSYNLNNPYQVSSESDYPGLVGRYTFNSTSQTNASSGVKYIVAVNNTKYYYIALSNETGSTHDLSFYNYTYTYGDSYQDNGDGTYTVLNQDESNPTTINRSDWYTSYSNIGAGKYVCKNAINDTCSELWYTTETSNTSMTYIKSTNNYKYAKSFEYKLDPDDGTYKYFLDDDTSTTFFEWNSSNTTSINNAHYTCWNKNGKCTTISYVYNISNNALFYINIAEGKSLENALDEMLTENNVNTINSTIKSGVEAWYKHTLLEAYDDDIEDTIFCNDRSIRALNGWNPDGGNTSDHLRFKEYTITNDLNCTNLTDKFSISNNLAHLTYKVGLMSSSEMNNLNNSKVRYTGDSYWLISPNDSYSYYSVPGGGISLDVSNYRVYGSNMQPGRNGTVIDCFTTAELGVRPAISLTPGTEYSDGDGSMANPYYIGEIYNITNTNNLFTVKEKSPPEEIVQIHSDDYVVTSFKLNGTLVNGDTFTMPEEDVTITDIQYVQANYVITNTDSDITVPSTGRYGSTITLESDNYKVTSFKLNGTLVNGNSFVMPAENVTITDINKVQTITVESAHNPYPNNQNNVIYYENTFDNATSLTVELTYQTEGISWDWIYLYDSSGGIPINNKKYGGTTLTTETITVNSNYLKIRFKTDSGGNNYYGFKAVIIPNYD